MEDEIDLREYVWALLRRWRLIVGLTLVAALAALGTSLLQPPSYEATALVAVTNPRYALQFEPRIETVDDLKPAYAAYPQLAMSDQVLGGLLAGLDPLPEGVESLRDLQGMVKAKAGADPSIVQLTVRAREGQVAARVANAWAEAFVTQANALYGVGSDEQAAFFAGQAEQARKTLAEAEQALAEFQGRNQAAILEARLGALKQDLEERLGERDSLAEIVRKAEALEARLSSQPAGARVPLADELTALLLQTRALGGGAPEVQVQASEMALPPSAQTAGELTASLGSLVSTLEGQADKLDERIASVQPEIVALQRDLQEAQAEESELVRERDVARDAYLSLAQKVAETRVAAEDPESEVRLASRAAVPERPAGQGKVLTTALAGMLGFMLGVFGALAMEWWRGGVAQKPGLAEGVSSAGSRPALGGTATQ